MKSPDAASQVGIFPLHVEMPQSFVAEGPAILGSVLDVVLKTVANRR
jgi:hypothetical protein